MKGLGAQLHSRDRAATLSPRSSVPSAGTLFCSLRAASKLARQKALRAQTSLLLFLSFAESSNASGPIFAQEQGSRPQAEAFDMRSVQKSGSSRTQRWIPVLVMLAVLAFGEPAQSQTPLEKVSLAYSSRSIASIDLYTALERGFFREEGLDPQLVLVRSNVAISAGLAGEIHAIGSIGTVIRAIARSDVPFKILAVNLKRPLFWLVTRPELTSAASLKGKTMGTTTFGGAQHVAGIRMLRKLGLDPDKDVTVIIAGDVPTQLQSLVSGAIQLAVLSPPTIIVARDKFKMRVLAASMEEFPSIQNGIAVPEKFIREKRDVVKRMLRARAKATRYFWENERGSSEILAKYLNVDIATALEAYRLSLPAFARNGIPSDKEIAEYLKMDAEIMGIANPVPASKVFDFSLQREVNQELGAR
jgi:NitT/TauT family transport system substrate-binding protein